MASAMYVLSTKKTRAIVLSFVPWRQSSRLHKKVKFHQKFLSSIGAFQCKATLPHFTTETQGVGVVVGGSSAALLQKESSSLKLRSFATIFTFRFSSWTPAEQPGRANFPENSSDHQATAFLALCKKKQ